MNTLTWRASEPPLLVVGEADPRGEGREAEEVAVVLGQRLDLLLGDVGRDLGALGLDQELHVLTDHGHVLGEDVARCEHELGVHVLADQHLHVAGLRWIGLRGDVQRVDARLEAGQGEAAVRAGRGRVPEAALAAHRHDRGAGERPRFVPHHAPDG
jgi:hypothetical protein